MKLIFVRHGESEANVGIRRFGTEDTKITPNGKEQARKVGKELKEKYKIDMIFCSPFKRCVQTLENILEENPIQVPVFMSKLIEERDYGLYKGMEQNLADLEELDQDIKINREMGVESLVDLRKRTDLFLEDLKLEEKSSTILIISHCDTIKMMLSKLTGKNWDEIEVKNGSITVFEKFK